MSGRYYRDLRRILRAHGCYLKRHGKGDHEIWFSPITGGTVTVDRGGRKRFTAQSVLTTAGIDDVI